MSRSNLVRLVPGIAVLFVALVGGCQTTNTKPADSEFLGGTVRLDGKLVNYGSVTFHSDKGQPLKGVIQLDGTYRIRKPPVGEVRVVVATGPAPRAVGTPGGGGGTPVVFETIKIPAKYASAETTDLRHVVTAEGNEYHIEMKSTPDTGKP